MLMLAGMMGLALVGASAFVGLSEDDPGDDLEGEFDEANLERHGAAGTGDPGRALLDLVENEIIVGTGGADALDGGDGDDQVGGYSGEDDLNGGAGADVIWAMGGADFVDGQSGDDELHGGGAEDSIFGGTGADNLFGHMGSDLLSGELGDDIAHGGEGNDLIKGGSGDDALHGGLGDDLIEGGAGNDTLFGGSGDDWIGDFNRKLADSDDFGKSIERDYLNGGEGNDTLVGDSGDVMTLGAGGDTAVLGSWIGSGDDAAKVMDFLTGEDQLILVCPEGTGTGHNVSIDKDPSETRIVLDGKVIAKLPSGTLIRPDDIVLMQESAAEAFMQPG